MKVNIQGPGSLGILSPSAKAQGKGGSFKEVMDALKQVSDLQNEASEQVQQLASGKDLDIHQVMIASQKAALALDMTLAVRNKVMEAYQELMRMQI